MRTEKFQRNEKLESLLGEINSILHDAEIQQAESNDINNHRPIFIVGPLRSGTTLMMQLIASTGKIAYPSNLLSRFYNAPIIGAKIQMLLTDPDYNFRNEILDFSNEIEYQSENGKTKGALSPNEFWYFWRRFITFGEIDYVENSKLLKQNNYDLFRQEIHGLINAFNKPFAMKALICNQNIGFLSALFPDALFIRMKRNPAFNIQSALLARERQLGSMNEWYSFKIKEYNQLKELDFVDQVVGQIFYINKSLDNEFSQLPENNKLIVDYEVLCENPNYIFDQIADLSNFERMEIKDSFSPRNDWKLKFISRMEVNRKYDALAEK